MQCFCGDWQMELGERERERERADGRRMPEDAVAVPNAEVFIKRQSKEVSLQIWR